MTATNKADRVLLALLALSLVANVAVVGWLVRGGPGAAAPTIAVGTKLDPITGVSKDGAPLTVSFEGDKPVVLYVFSPACVWCERNRTSIQSLVSAGTARFRFVGVSLAPNTNGGDDGFEFPVVFSDGRPLPFASTPLTLVVGRDGRVLQSWPGAYTGPAKRRIEEYFAVSLPALVTSRNGGR